MAYEPKTWECGEVVTADALNHIEQGIAESGGGEHFKITVTRTNGTLTADKTFQEIKSAIQSGKIAYVEYDPSGAGYQLKHFVFDVLNTTYDEVSSDVNFHCAWLERTGKLHVEAIRVTYENNVVYWSSSFNYDGT